MNQTKQNRKPTVPRYLRFRAEFFLLLCLQNLNAVRVIRVSARTGIPAINVKQIGMNAGMVRAKTEAPASTVLEDIIAFVSQVTPVSSVVP